MSKDIPPNLRRYNRSKSFHGSPNTKETAGYNSFELSQSNSPTRTSVDRTSNISSSLMEYPTIRSEDTEAILSPNISTIQGGIDFNSNTPCDSIFNSGNSDVVKVEITDFAGIEESINLTTAALRRCKSEVLQPYWRLLKFVGWRAFGKESIFQNSWSWRIRNIIYTTTVVLLLLFTYVYEALVCQWKIDFSTDSSIIIKPITLPTTQPTTPYNTTIVSIPWIDIKPVEIIIENVTQPEVADIQPQCQHVVTSYIVPHLLHLTAFIIGFYFFRIQETEQLNSLIEKVFLQATPSPGNSASRTDIIVRLRGLLCFGIIWVVLNIILQCLFVYAFTIFPTHYTKQPPMNNRIFSYLPIALAYSLTGVSMLGIIMMSAVYLAIVLNYASQCEILIFYARGIQFRIQERSGDMKTIMKDILFMRQCLGVLNGPMAGLTSLVCVTFAEMTIIGIGILILNEIDIPIFWVYRVFFPFCWSIMLLFPLVQAARMNAQASTFKKFALETRVFGFHQSSLIELDSFLNFVSHTELRAKLFQVAILPSYLTAIVALIAIVFLLLLQMGVIGKDSLI